MVNIKANQPIRSDEFCWDGRTGLDLHQSYIYPQVIKEINRLFQNGNGSETILDLGCGNGVFAGTLSNSKYDVIACDSSVTGIQIAKEKFPEVSFFQQDVNNDLMTEYQEKFDLVVSLEVIEHLFQPRLLFDRARQALKGDGYLIISTPYHGYIKNILLALFNKFDDHWHPLTDFGHIKFFSKKTITQCINECGFKVIDFIRVGRVPIIAKSMIIVCRVA